MAASKCSCSLFTSQKSELAAAGRQHKLEKVSAERKKMRRVATRLGSFIFLTEVNNPVSTLMGDRADIMSGK